MAQQTLAATQITLYDLNDAVISTTAPLNPPVDQLWIDSSTTPPTLRRWTGSSWVVQNLSLENLDPVQYQNINSALTALSDMSSDSIITQSERILVKTDMTNIIGFVPLDNNVAISNFVSKVTASMVENANIAKYSGSSSIQSPTGSWTEDAQSYYNNISILDNVIFTISTGSANGAIAQGLYSFNLVEYVKRIYGYTPTVTWLKNNVKSIKFNWFGYGSSINGSKAYVDAWNYSANSKWGTVLSHTNATITALTWDSGSNQTNVQNLMDANGMVSFLSYSDAAGLISATTAPQLSVTPNAGSTLTANTYYVVYTWVTPNGESTVSIEASITVAAGNNLVVTIPAKPFGVTQGKIYISTSSGTETYQGNTTSTTYTQSTPLGSGLAKPTSNTAVVTSINCTDYAELVVELHPIPTTTGLDALGVGSFSTIRQAALSAGILGTDTHYTNLASQYMALKTYLEGLTPVFPWNTIASDTISVDASVWRNTWSNYYLAEYQLQQYTTQILQGNINAVQPSGRNLLINTALMTDNTLPYWALNIGSAVTGQLNGIYVDPVYGGVLWATLSANAASGNNWFVIENTSLTLPNGKFVTGQTYTLSFLIKNAFGMYVNFMDSTGANAVTSNFNIPINSDWTRYVYTFQATSAGNIPLFYLAKNDTSLVGDVYLTQVKLETGNRATGWSAAPEEIGSALASLQTRVTNVEQNTTADSISSTVVSSDQFASIMQGKANASDLANYATQDQLTQTQTDANAYTDGKVGSIDMTPYATLSYVNQTSTSITEQFSSFGGVNIIRNSVGYSLGNSGTPYPNPSFWTVTPDGSAVVTQSSELAPYGSGSGFFLNGSTMTQTITVQPNMVFTISAYAKKGTAGTGYLSVSDGNQTITTNLASGTAYNYQQISVTISPNGTSLTVTINGDSASGGVTFTSLMGNIGANPLQWTNHPQEIYNTNFQADLNGLRIIQSENGVQTAIAVMSPTKFAGYADQTGDGVIDQTTGSLDEVFRMDRTTFVMRSATIGPIEIVPLTTGGYNGIAFVSST